MTTLERQRLLGLAAEMECSIDGAVARLAALSHRISTTTTSRPLLLRACEIDDTLAALRDHIQTSRNARILLDEDDE